MIEQEEKTQINPQQDQGKDSSLGQVLKQRREELNIQTQEVATYLKVKIRDIDAIERDSLFEVTSHLYIPGLVRSYAKFLKFDPQIFEEKVKTLKVKSNTDAREHKLLNIGEDTEITPSKDSFFNFSLISVLIFLVLLSIYNSYLAKDSLITNQKLISELESVN